MTTLKKFETGKSYYARSICNHDCIFTIEVVKRTAKTVTYRYQGKEWRSNIKLDEHGNEYIKPENYSMAPVFRAERQQEEPEQEEATTEEKTEETAEVQEIEKSVLESALLDYMDKLQKSLVKKMQNCRFEGYKAPVLGIENDKKFIEAANYYFPVLTQRYLTAVRLYEEV